tara:strand:+ start:4187 stop:4729 length:543 start_codon:yes stop_codon:yes gene_type:complete
MEDDSNIKFLNRIEVNPDEVKLCIETGTHRGWGTVKWAYFFNEVITIELSKELFEYCKQEYDLKNVKFLQGSSHEVLQDIIDDIKCPYFLFLDAHGSGGDTTYDKDIGMFGSPVIKELQAVRNNPPEFICIDDLSDFKEIPSYPTLEEIEKEVSKIGEYTCSTYMLDEFTKGILVFKLNK